MKNILKIITCFILFACICFLIFLYSVHISVNEVHLVHEKITSKKIGKQLDNITIAYISDLHYSSFMNKDRLNKMFDTFSKTGADLILFGGDLFANTDTQLPNEQVQQELTTLLQSLHAPLGKFAVLGDQDQCNPEIKAICESILFESDFELLTNRSVRIHNKGNDSFHLIGLDSMIHGNVDVGSAFETMNPKEFTILFTHCPDIIKKSEINSQKIDLALAGHSLGGQLYIPLLGPLKTFDGAKYYNHGVHTINDTKLYVSNGLGTIDSDIRLFCPPQIYIFQLTK